MTIIVVSSFLPCTYQLSSVPGVFYIMRLKNGNKREITSNHGKMKQLLPIKLLWLIDQLFLKVRQTRFALFIIYETKIYNCTFCVTVSINFFFRHISDILFYVFAGHVSRSQRKPV